MELSRRMFVKLCGATAGALGLSAKGGADRAAAQDAATGGGGVILPRIDMHLHSTASMVAKDLI